MASFLIKKDHTVSFTRHHCQIPSNPAFSDLNHQARRHPRSSACVVHELHKNQNPRATLRREFREPNTQQQAITSATPPLPVPRLLSASRDLSLSSQPPI
ncbi:hypothetical protein M0R45_036398 [Rubus argutus]|uniref:Uncharacterized protein n=1 Tax=Rubus argutus TaxID=59490 RepID=A0AAW1VZI1_RUBAR